MDWHEGDVIRKLRSQVHWTLRKLSKVSGVSPQVINRLEKGHTRDVKRTTLERLARAFGLNERALRNAVPSNGAPLVIRLKRPRPTTAVRTYERVKRRRRA